MCIKKERKKKKEKPNIKTVCWFSFFLIIFYFYKYYCNSIMYYDFANQNPFRMRCSERCFIDVSTFFWYVH